jgi:hypothetical protein
VPPGKASLVGVTAGGQDVDDLIERVGKAASAADLFGAMPLDQAQHRWRTWLLLLHPDANPGNDHAAAAAQRLSELWQDYKRPAPAFIEGDLANLFWTADGLLKMPRDLRDNDLMIREALAYRDLKGVDKQLRLFFPWLLAAQRQQDPGDGKIRRANLLKPLDGFYTLEQVRATPAYRDGIDPRDAAWMWRRLLAALGAAHQQGIIHGAVLPGNVMICPDQVTGGPPEAATRPTRHGLVLADWCYSATGDQKIPAVVRRYRDWYPPEVLAKQTPGPGTDLYMAAQLLRYLMAGRCPAPLDAFAKGCMMTSLQGRPDDAWALRAEFTTVLERLFGPPQFHPFTMPAPAGPAGG